MSETFCILPFIHLEARSDSYVAPCCMSQEFYRKDNGEFFTLSRDTLSEVWNSNNIKQLREELLSGNKPTACSACWQEETLGKESKRIRENKRWGTDPTPNLKFVDLKLGNTCNLKCRICSPGSSSNWIKEHKDIYGSDIVSDIALKFGQDRKTIMQWPQHNPEFWDDLDKILPDVEMFEIYGGEPFLIERHYDVLRKSIDLGYSKNQRIHYNTNGTIYPEDAVNNIWPQFKEVDIMLSIDGVGDQFEYQRYPAKWDSVLENIHKFKEHFDGRIEICLSVSSHNVFYLPEYLLFFSELDIPVWLNIVYHPDVYSICNLAHNTKKEIDAKLSKYLHLNRDLSTVINYLWTSSKDMQGKFINKVKLHDNYRSQNFFETFPEYGEILCRS